MQQSKRFNGDQKPEYKKLPNRTAMCQKKSKRRVQGVQQTQTAALPRHKEEKETDKTKQAQIEQTHETQ